MTDASENARDEILLPQYEKRPYKGVFHLPATNWRVEAIWDDGYFQAAKTLIEGVARGEYRPALEGVAGLYLFRHYIEIALKFIIFHSRWLKDAHTNANDQEVEDVKKTHSLKKLWTTAAAECQRIIPEKEWSAIDVEFVQACIDEFDTIDPVGERFRYHGDRFGIEKDPAKREEMAQAARYELYVDFPELTGVVDHIHDVLQYLDVYMIETHGENEDWQDILNSF